jgi:hypothetical protein
MDLSPRPSLRSLRVIVWIVGLLTVPVPFAMLVSGWVPAAWLWWVGSVLATIAITEHDYTSSLLGGAFLAQAALWSALLYVGARTLVGLVTRTTSAHRWRPAIVAVVTALVVMACFDVYWSPVTRRGPRTNIAGVFG